MSITQAELSALMHYESRPERRILSVYLDIDQSRAANLNRGFVTSLTQSLRAMHHGIAPEPARQKFWADAECVLGSVQKATPQGRSLVAFCDTATGFLFERELRVPIERTEVRWEEKPHLRPLLDLMDEYERYAVVLVDKQEARLFTVWLGEIEENREIFSERRKRSKQAGKDNTLSQSNLQRRDDEHAHQHLKEVADALDTLHGQKAFDRLVIAGGHEASKALEARLSKRLQDTVVRTVSLPVGSSENEVLATTLKIQEEAERANETATVERLITAAAKDNQGAMGLRPTLEALRQGRIMSVVYVHDFVQDGKQCSQCGSLFTNGLEACSYCSGAVERVPDVISRVLEKVVSSGGHAESVRGPAAERLRETGNIGAFLRF